jgi:ABC-type glycerol-3-phosphate transport system substrate-binding protein
MDEPDSLWVRSRRTLLYFDSLERAASTPAARSLFLDGPFIKSPLAHHREIWCNGLTSRYELMDCILPAAYELPCFSLPTCFLLSRVAVGEINNRLSLSTFYLLFALPTERSMETTTGGFWMMSKHISRRSFLQISGVVAAAGVLAACVPATAPQADGETSATGASDTINLKWDTFRGPGTGWNEERIDTFKETHPNVNIEFRPLTGASQQDNYGKMYAMHAAGDLGDICAFDPSHYHFWRAIDKQIIMPIDDLAEAADTDLTQWFERFMSLQYRNGTLYGLPSWGWAGWDTLVTNAVHLREAGIELPDPVGHDTPMDTIGEWARQLFVDGERFGIAVGVAGSAETAFTVLNRIWNSDLINEEGTKCVILDDPNSQAAFRWLYDLAVVDKVMPAQGSIENLLTATQEGKISMDWGGSLDVRNFKRANTDPAISEVTQILFPTREDGRFPSQMRGGTWNILNGSAHPTEAYAFLEHITSLDGAYGFNLVAGQGAFVRPDVLEKLIADDPIHEWFVPNLENGIAAHAPANSRGREYTDACNQYGSLLLDPTQPVEFEQGLQDLHDNIQAVLDMDPA